MNEEMKMELEALILWAYNSSFNNLFTYNKADQSKKLSKISEEKINKLIKKYGL